jgi:arginine decarboxylase
MGTIRIVRGTGAGSTAMGSYDTALADAGICNYNLVSVSSVIPADVDVEVVETAPDLGPPGERLTVVEGRATVAGPGRASAALAWSQSRDGGPGLFYEAAGQTDSEDVSRRAREGIETGMDLRSWPFTEPQLATASTHADPGTYATAVVVAVYGESEPLV